MPLTVQDCEDDEGYVLVAKTDNARHISTILRTINFSHQQATCVVTSSGIKFIVEESKCVQATAFLQKELFEEYYAKENYDTFGVNLSVMLECLTMLSTGANYSPILKMTYKGQGNPLTLMLEDDGVLIDCNIKTIETAEMLDFNFAAANIISRIIVKGEFFRDTFSDLDPSSDTLQICLSPDSNNLVLITNGYSGATETTIPANSELIVSFTCSKESKEIYKLNFIKLSAKALGLAEKVSIRVDDRGFICLQYLIKLADDLNSFVEFCCVPQEEETDDMT